MTSLLENTRASCTFKYQNNFPRFCLFNRSPRLLYLDSKKINRRGCYKTGRNECASQLKYLRKLFEENGEMMMKIFFTIIKTFYSLIIIIKSKCLVLYN